MNKAEYAKLKLAEVKGVEVKTSAPTFNEFIVKLPKDPEEVIAGLIERKIAAGFPLGRYYEDMADYMLVAVTEKRTREEIDMFAHALGEVLWS